MEWTDERLDDLANRVDVGFAEVKRDLRELRQELKGDMDAMRSELKGDINGLRGEFNGLRGEFNGLRDEVKGLHRLMVQSAIAISVGLLGLLGTGAISLIAG